jgi:hypothetical protein
MQWKNNKYYHFQVYVCSLRSTTCNAHAPYCHLWHVRLHNIFPYYLINCTIFEKKIIKCVFSFSLQLLSETFLILRRTERDRLKNVYLSSYKMTAILVRFKYTLYFLDRFSKNAHISNLIKICPVGAELFHKDIRT